jgi:predicted nucleotidyltransferase
MDLSGVVQPDDSDDAHSALTQRQREALAAWGRAVDCRLLVVFGSAATPGTKRVGDIDLALSFPELPSPERRLAMVGELQDLCGGRRVDLVFLRTETDPVLRFEVFRGGQPIYESGPGIFIDETVRAIAFYDDALPFRRALQEGLLSRSRRS